MKDLLKSELMKLGTTKTAYFLLAGVIAISLVTVLDPNYSASTFGKPFNEQTFVLFTSMLTRLLIFVLGVRLITEEFRHGSIVPTLLASPLRGRVLAAKGVIAGGAGLIAGVVAWISMTGAAAVVAWSEGTSLVLDTTAWQTFGGMAAAGLMWGVIGLFVGGVVRHQLAATIGGLLWLMGIEDMFRGFLGDAGGYLPGQAGLSMILVPDGERAVTAAAIFLGYALVLAVVAWRSMRRDIA